MPITPPPPLSEPRFPVASPSPGPSEDRGLSKIPIRGAPGDTIGSDPRGKGDHFFEDMSLEEMKQEIRRRSQRDYRLAATLGQDDLYTVSPVPWKLPSRELSERNTILINLIGQNRFDRDKLLQKTFALEEARILHGERRADEPSNHDLVARGESAAAELFAEFREFIKARESVGDRMVWKLSDRSSILDFVGKVEALRIKFPMSEKKRTFMTTQIILNNLYPVLGTMRMAERPVPSHVVTQGREYVDRLNRILRAENKFWNSAEPSFEAWLELNHASHDYYIAATMVHDAYWIGESLFRSETGMKNARARMSEFDELTRAAEEKRSRLIEELLADSKQAVPDKAPSQSADQNLSTQSDSSMTKEEIRVKIRELLKDSRAGHKFVGEVAGSLFNNDKNETFSAITGVEKLLTRPDGQHITDFDIRLEDAILECSLQKNPYSSRIVFNARRIVTYEHGNIRLLKKSAFEKSKAAVADFYKCQPNAVKAENVSLERKGDDIYWQQMKKVNGRYEPQTDPLPVMQGTDLYAHCDKMLPETQKFRQLKRFVFNQEETNPLGDSVITYMPNLDSEQVEIHNKLAQHKDAVPARVVCTDAELVSAIRHTSYGQSLAVELFANRLNKLQQS